METYFAVGLSLKERFSKRHISYNIITIIGKGILKVSMRICLTIVLLIKP